MRSNSDSQTARHNRIFVFLAYCIVALVAFIPRALELDRFLTVDEANFWVERSSIFLNALQAGDFLGTAVSSHPGVTTMWLGAAGIVLRRALTDWGMLGDISVAGAIGMMRLPLVLVHSAGILLGYALLRRLLPLGAALLAAILWAADPFMIGYSRLLHTDALLATFAMLSVLAACCYWYAGARQPMMLILSGVCAGLAILSKSPGFALIPCVVAIAFLESWRHHQAHQVPFFQFWFGVFRSSLVPIIIWGAATLITMLLLWPALWAGPLKIYEQIRVGVEVEGAQPHMLGNFFLGKADDAPGLLFYPVALALRLTPITLIGLLLLPLVLRLPVAAKEQKDGMPAVWRMLAVMAGFAIVFVCAMSLFPKKFNRYILPAFPMLDILAAFGIYSVGSVICRHLWRLPAAGRRSATTLLLSLVALLSITNAATWHPYSIAAFNQALGGAPAGARTFAVGWGEGYELVAAWLNQQPDITGVGTLSRLPIVQNPYMRRGANAQNPQSGALPPATGYAVVYISQVQGSPPAAPFDQFYGRAVPLHTVQIEGVEYAWIYQVPPPVAQLRPAAFGDALHLRGFEQQGQPTPGATLLFRLQWEVNASLPADYNLFVHLVNSEGTRVAQLDPAYPTTQWEPGRFQTTEIPLTLPPDLPPGEYKLLIGLYDPAAAGARLPLGSPHTADPALSGSNALLLATLELR